MSGSPRCKHARLVGREVVKLSASVSLQVCVESDTTVKISPYLPRIYQQFLPDQDSAPKFAARTDSNTVSRIQRACFDTLHSVTSAPGSRHHMGHPWLPRRPAAAPAGALYTGALYTGGRCRRALPVSIRWAPAPRVASVVTVVRGLSLLLSSQ